MYTRRHQCVVVSGIGVRKETCGHCFTVSEFPKRQNYFKANTDRNAVYLVTVMYVTNTIVGRVSREILFIHDAPDGCLERLVATTQRVKPGRFSLQCCHAPRIFLSKILA
jgi:hypothetical protein